MPSIPIDGNLDLQNLAKVVNAPTPTSAGDLVPKSYADAIAQGIIFKKEVQAASTGANVSVAAPGATLDTVTLTTGMRILLKDQAAPAENGLWLWNGAAAALTRPTDFAAGSTQSAGTSVFVAQGSAAGNLGAQFTMTTDAVNPGTTSQTWVQSNALTDVTVSAPLTKTGNAIAITNPLPVANGGTNATTAAAARASLSAVGKFATTIGDGAATTFTVTHNLGTTDVQVQVWDMATGNYEIVGVAVTGVNAVSVGPFAAAPAAAGGSLPGGTGKRVVVMG